MSERNEWLPIEEAPVEVDMHKPVDLWLSVHASPRSFGWSDAFRVTDCYRKLVTSEGFVGPWVHIVGGREKELFSDYITHWMPLPDPPPPPKGSIKHETWTKESNVGR